jgi:rubrerythrin
MRDIEGALAVLQHAIHNEIVGQRFYDDAARYCVDLWAKDVFTALAREEEEHTRLLLVEYESLKTQGCWIDIEIARASDAEVDIAGISFADGGVGEDLFPVQSPISESVDRRADDLAALALGIRMEQEAIDLYGLQADTAEDPAVRETYRILAQEETRHYAELRSQWEKLAGTAFEVVESDNAP